MGYFQFPIKIPFPRQLLTHLFFTNLRNLIDFVQFRAVRKLNLGFEGIFKIKGIFTEFDRWKLLER